MHNEAPLAFRRLTAAAMLVASAPLLSACALEDLPLESSPASEAPTARATQALVGSWALWADPSNGLPAIHPFKNPRLWIHDGETFYFSGSESDNPGLGGVDGLGRAWKASVDPNSPSYKTFTLMPQTGLIFGGITAIVTNAAGDLILGTKGGNPSGSQPIIFRFDTPQNQWIAATLSGGPWPTKRILGLARAPNGGIWATGNHGVFKSTDGGKSFVFTSLAPLLDSIAARKPSVGGITYGITVSPTGAIYVGSEGAGFVYSENDGASWASVDPNWASAQSQVKMGWTNNSYGAGMNKAGNVIGTGGLDSINNLPFANVGTNMYLYDVATKTDQFVSIPPGTLKYGGFDTRIIPLTTSGHNFISLQVNGVWASPDGVSWSPFKTGMTTPTYYNICNPPCGLCPAGSDPNTCWTYAEGSIVTDGNDVYAATGDGKLWHYNTTAADQCAGLADGTACDDADACTQADVCTASACAGVNAVVCAASDACHDVGVCNPGTGQCSNPNKFNGAACNDGNACTVGDTCQGGVCSQGVAVACAAADECHDSGTCAPATGICSSPMKAEGAPCPLGACQSGICVAPDAGGGTGGGTGTGGSGGAASTTSGTGGSPSTSATTGGGGAAATTSGVGGSPSASSATGSGGAASSSGTTGGGGTDPMPTTTGGGAAGTGGQPTNADDAGDAAGCGCRTATTRPTSAAWFGVGLGLVAALRRRRSSAA